MLRYCRVLKLPSATPVRFKAPVLSRASSAGGSSSIAVSSGTVESSSAVGCSRFANNIHAQTHTYSRTRGQTIPYELSKCPKRVMCSRADLEKYTEVPVFKSSRLAAHGSCSVLQVHRKISGYGTRYMVTADVIFYSARPYTENGQMLKYVSLVTLTLQNALVGLSMRYARTRAGDMFLSSTAVVMSELAKLLTCLILVYMNEKSLERFANVLKTTIIDQPLDTLKVCVPSLLYIIQNNLLYVSASNLDAATYQVTYQLKILTTAFFAVTILRKSLQKIQWGALCILLLGVVLVQLAQAGPEKVASGIEQNHWLGFSAALTACFISGFAGIYFEKILKGSDISIWMRNVQLSLLSLPFGFATCFINDHAEITTRGFFTGYDAFVCYLIMLQACGGLVVAMVVKYADNILKGFATSLAIIISCVASIYLFDFKLTAQFASGAALVICSIFMYSHQPNTTATDKTATEKV